MRRNNNLFKQESPKVYDLCVFGNAVVDGFARVEESVLEKYGMPKGNTSQFDHQTFMRFNEDVMIESFNAGGSAANMAWTIAKLGCKTAFLGHVGADPAGRHFYEEMRDAGVDMKEPDVDVRTFQVFVLVTPDGDRTFAQARTTALMTPDWVSDDAIKNSKWLLVEGYPLLDQMAGVQHALAVARASGVKVMLSLAPPFFIEQAATGFNELIEAGVDLLFSDDEEWHALQRVLSPAAEAMLEKTPRVTTHSGAGASYFDATGQETQVPCPEVKQPVDATGAGDSFAAGFLAARLQGLPPAEALARGHKIAGQVIMQVGGRLRGTF
jgi:hypothetical protein